jgi:hypothetical protein
MLLQYQALDEGVGADNEVIWSERLWFWRIRVRLLLQKPYAELRFLSDFPILGMALLPISQLDVPKCHQNAA